jgi:hypothetical protein
MLHGAFLARFGVAGRIGHVAEWLRSGLQIRAPRFDSGRGLHISWAFDQLVAHGALLAPMTK